MTSMQLCKVDNGVEFVQFTERGRPKPDKEACTPKHCDFQPRMFILSLMKDMKKDAQWLF